MNNSNNYSRREFLNTCGKMSSIPVMSSVLSLQMTNQVLAQNTFTDYKALVCVFLRGGNDSFNMLMPGDTDGINQYREVRGAIASPINSGLEITGKQRDGSSRKFRVHPRMPEVRTMFNQGDLGFVANVGTLIRPTTVAEYRNGVNRPRGLFSHFEQEVSWQTSVPDSNPKHGWFGRMSEVLNSRLQNSDRVSMNISFIGNNRLQTGFNTSGFVASTRLGSYSGYTRLTHDAGMDQAYKTVIQNQVDYTRNSIIDQSEAYAEAVDGANLNTEFPRTALGSQLRDVAIAISRRGILGKSRQTFYVSENGYDTHSEVVSTQNERLPDVSEALYAFNEAMKELGVHDSVVTYTASDFGRSSTTNGSGTDHGWGGNQIVMGGPVKAQAVGGVEYPTDLSLGAATDIGRGRQLPTLSVDRMFGELSHWYGVPNNNDMVTTLPNIRNFWNANAGRSMGFI